MQSMSKHLSFLSIPTEIRLKIYDHVFADAILDVDRFGGYSPRTGSEVLSVCHITRIEALPRYQLKVVLRERVLARPHGLHNLGPFFRSVTTRIWAWQDFLSKVDSLQELYPALKQLKFRVARSASLLNQDDVTDPLTGSANEFIQEKVESEFFDVHVTSHAEEKIDSQVAEKCRKLAASGVEVLCQTAHVIYVGRQGSILMPGEIGTMVSDLLACK